MARLSHDERRLAIVDAALAVARRKGLGATTVRDVAAEMGTSSGLIHHYFESMDDVLAEAFSRAARSDLDAATRAVDGADGPVAALVGFFETYAPADSDWSFQLWLDAWSEAARRPSLRDMSARLNVAWQELVAGIVSDGADAAVFDVEDAEGSAWRIISMLDGLVLQVVAHRTTVTRARMLEWARRGAEAELGLARGALDSAPVGDQAGASAGDRRRLP